VVVEVSAPVLKEPVVPVPLLPEEAHEVLLVDVQLTVVLALYAIEVGDAETDTAGRGRPGVGSGILMVSVVVGLTPPPHATSARAENNAAKNIFKRVFDKTSLLFDISVSRRNDV
jgi:hypothetical protein